MATPVSVQEGQVGDSHVSFIVTRSANTAATTEMTLDIDQLGCEALVFPDR